MIDPHVTKLTLAQCVRLTGYTPSPSKVANEDERTQDELKLARARAHVHNRVITKVLPLADVVRVLNGE